MNDFAIKKSKIDRQGLFANRNFKKGEVVTKWDTSKVISPEEYEKISDEVKEHISNLGNGKYLIVQAPEKYINHSCDPNTYVYNAQDIALRDINSREEITSDYSTDSIGKHSFKCNCGSINCKQIIYY